MKRNLMIGLVMVVVGILIIAGASFGLLGMYNNYAPKVGDFLKYRTMTGPPNTTVNQTFLILGVNSTYVYYSETTTSGPFDGWINGLNYTEYFNTTKNQTWFLFDTTHPREYFDNWNYTGADTIQFDWGARSANKYSYSLGDSYYSGTMWVRNGVLVKYLIVEFGVITWDTMLIDSNIPQIID